MQTTGEIIRIGYADMWDGFNPSQYRLMQLLKKHYPIELSDTPDYLFFSVFGDSHLSRSAKCKIFVTHEAAFPDFRFCDYALSFYWKLQSARHIYYPNFLLYTDRGVLEQLGNAHEHVDSHHLNDKNIFCGFLFSNGNARIRQLIFESISEYKQVTSAGKHSNNLGYVLARNDTMNFFRRCKFIIASENSKAPGYVTEKILQAFLAGAIPIYWGDDFVFRLFNRERFIYANDHESLSALTAHVREIDTNNNTYMDIIQKPIFPDGVFPEILSEDVVVTFFHKLFSGQLADEKKPTYPASELGQLKGQHRRWLQAPMCDVEKKAFDTMQANLRARGLMD